MADKDEKWDGPVDEASVPMADRLVTLEAGDIPEEVTESFPPIEERVARLERIAEYLHDARKEAAALAHSVDTLAGATKALTALLAAIEEQQKRIEALDEKVDARATETDAFRTRAARRSLVIGLCLAVLLAVGGGMFVVQERTIGRIEREAEASIERLSAESVARATANCEATNEGRQGIREFILEVFPPAEDGTIEERGGEIIALSEVGFPQRDCAQEIAAAQQAAAEEAAAAKAGQR